MTEVSTEALLTQTCASQDNLYCTIALNLFQLQINLHLIVDVEYLYNYDLLADWFSKIPGIDG